MCYIVSVMFNENLVKNVGFKFKILAYIYAFFKRLEHKKFKCYVASAIIIKTSNRNRYYIDKVLCVFKGV